MTRRPITEAEEARRRLEAAKALRERIGRPTPPRPTLVDFRPPPLHTTVRRGPNKNPYRIIYPAPIGPINARRPTPLVTPPRITVREIALRLAHLHEVTWAELLGPRRGEQRVVACRQEICWVADAVTWAGLTQIGKVLMRDHTTVLHGIRRFSEAYGVPWERHTPSARQIGLVLLDRPSVEIVL